MGDLSGCRWTAQTREIGLWHFSIVFLLGLVFLPAVAAQAQSGRYQELLRKVDRPRIFVEPAVLPQLKGKAGLGISYRIPHALLRFRRTARSNQVPGFEANVAIQIDLRRNDSLYAERRWEQNRFVDSYDRTQSREQAVRGTAWFDVSPGKYRYQLVANDQTTGRTYRSRPFAVSVPTRDSLIIARPIVARRFSHKRDHVVLEPAVLSGRIPFGQSSRIVVPLQLPDSLRGSGVRLSYSLRHLRPGWDAETRDQRREQSYLPPSKRTAGDPSGETDAGTVVRSDTVLTEVVTGIGRLASNDTTSVRWKFEGPGGGIGSGRARSHLWLLNLNGRTLESGTYSLSVQLHRQGEIAFQRRFSLSTYWPDMPVSLYDVEVAIDHLSFIADGETLDQIDSGSREERIEKLLAFWDEKDPSPDTPYNELMAEYYERIDHAAQAFRTLQGRGLDGLRSDRARVYIVYGPPDARERTVPERGTARERWTYADGKVFVFEATSSNDRFKLVERHTKGG